MSTSEESKDKSKKAAQKKVASKKGPSKEAKELTSIKESFELEKDKYLHLFAEFENFKKRTSKERIELFKTAGQDVIVDLLPVLDNFERALQEVEK